MVYGVGLQACAFVLVSANEGRTSLAAMLQVCFNMISIHSNINTTLVNVYVDLVVFTRIADTS